VEKKLQEYEHAWGMTHATFNVDSINNLVHLRADWHRSCNANHWAIAKAIVPNADILLDIKVRYQRNEKWGYNDYPHQKRTFEFVAFPPIYEKPIYRACDLDEQLDDMEYGDNRGDMDNNEAKNTDVDETGDADRDEVQGADSAEVQGADIGMAGGADNSAAGDIDGDDDRSRR